MKLAHSSGKNVNFCFVHTVNNYLPDDVSAHSLAAPVRCFLSFVYALPCLSHSETIKAVCAIHFVIGQRLCLYAESDAAKKHTPRTAGVFHIFCPFSHILLLHSNVFYHQGNLKYNGMIKLTQLQARGILNSIQPINKDVANAFLASISVGELTSLDSASLLQQAIVFETAGWMNERQLLLRRRSKFAPHASVDLLRHSIWFAQLCPAKRQDFKRGRTALRPKAASFSVFSPLSAAANSYNCAAPRSAKAQARRAAACASLPVDGKLLLAASIPGKGPERSSGPTLQ